MVPDRPASQSTRIKALAVLHGIFLRARTVWRLPSNPVNDVEKPSQRQSGEIEVFSPDEVSALVRAAGSEQDAAILLTAAFTGLRRGELVALRWREVDFNGNAIRVRASYAMGALTTPKSGKVRSVPMAPEVAQSLAGLAGREDFTAPADLVFPGAAGDYLDAPRGQDAELVARDDLDFQIRFEPGIVSVLDRVLPGATRVNWPAVAGKGRGSSRAAAPAGAPRRSPD